MKRVPAGWLQLKSGGSQVADRHRRQQLEANQRRLLIQFIELKNREDRYAPPPAITF